MLAPGGFNSGQIEDHPLESRRVIEVKNYVTEGIDHEALAAEGGVFTPIAPVDADYEDLVFYGPGNEKGPPETCVLGFPSPRYE